jgi:hypothetical protein
MAKISQYQALFLLCVLRRARASGSNLTLGAESDSLEKFVGISSPSEGFRFSGVFDDETFDAACKSTTDRKVWTFCGPCGGATAVPGAPCVDLPNNHLSSSGKAPGSRRRNENGKVERLGCRLRRRNDSRMNTI